MNTDPSNSMPHTHPGQAPQSASDSPSRESAGGLDRPAKPEEGPALRGWKRDLARILLVWGALLAVTVPFFWIARKRGAELVEMIKARDPAFTRVRSEAYYARGRLRYLEGKYDEAAFYLDKAYKTNPSLADARYYLGLIHKEKQEWSQALAEFQATLLEDSKHFAARFELAEILANRGKAYQATQALLTLEDILPKQSPLREELKLRTRLVPLAEEMLLDNPRHPQALLVTAEEAVRKQNLDEAERIYEKVLDLYPKNLAAFQGLVEVAEKREDPLQAIGRLTDLLRSYPNLIGGYDRLQSEIEKAGLPGQRAATGLFRQLDRLQPEHRVRDVLRPGMRLAGFDLAPLPTIYLNHYAIQLHWIQEQGLVWEAERVRPIYRLQDNLYARQERLFEVYENNVVPNPGFECAEPGPAFPAEWPGEYYFQRDVSQGWLQVIQEDVAEQKTNRYVRLDATALPEPAPIGLLSRRFSIRPRQTYLLGLRVRNRGGSPHVILRWQESEEVNVQVSRSTLRCQTNDWELQHLIVTSAPLATLVNLVLSNPQGEGIVDFDDVFLIALEGLD